MLRAVPIDSQKMWLTNDFGVYSLYYNPAIHDKESMELVCQMVEKNVYDTTVKTMEYRLGRNCCRADYNFTIFAAEAFGNKHIRENFIDTPIGQILQPNGQITLNAHAFYYGNVFCCCRENGCSIF
ncbi:UNKNOWN [Stylonychia lemnae]|uniref:Uncharacterized protein n=1 Tax=Stylonychia lemnae TaxID=5949 RepID=A0A078A0F7_STYLE|nr:UNKNOWN [Stylonychia lemnae]|eukprot:CDW74933.1 UNKNOWN [Stylonychia lemnae]